MFEWLADYLPTWAAILVAAALAAGILVSFVGGAAFLFIWAERKISGRIQDRLGPTRTGPFGLLQSLADGIKLISKEDSIPDQADRVLFRIAPYLAFCGSFCAFLALPFGNKLVPQSLSTAAFFMLAVLSSEVFGVMLAGYSSGSKWALFGGVREAAQVVSYEVPRSLSVLVPICVFGTLNLNEMGERQTGWFTNWMVFHDPFNYLAFFLFFITATASCKRAPFDLAEAESELVAGFHTEYSGFRWSVFFLAEYGSMFAVSGMAVLLFLGGWHTGFLPFEPTERLGIWAGNLLNAGVFIGKGAILVLIMMWVRWSLPRLRIDQVMMICLKYFLPIGCALLIGVCVWQLYFHRWLGEVMPPLLGFGSLLFGVVVIGSLFTAKGVAPRGAQAGVWAAEKVNL
jgi:NADH-quinone oxidoreductase subunit H